MQKNDSFESPKIENTKSGNFAKNIFLNHWKIKLIFFVLLLFLLIGVIFLLKNPEENNFKKNSSFVFNKNQQENNSKKIFYKEKPTYAQYITACLKNSDFSSQCEIAFTDPKIEKTCEEIKENKDLCFYKAAEINNNLNYCWKIQDNQLKQNCLQFTFEDFEIE